MIRIYIVESLNSLIRALSISNALRSILYIYSFYLLERGLIPSCKTLMTPIRQPQSFPEIHSGANFISISPSAVCWRFLSP
jgi:hypothetical protein